MTASVEAGHHVAAAGGRAAAASSRRQPSHGLSTTSSCAMLALGDLDLARLLLAAGDLARLQVLVGLARASSPCGRPLSDHSIWVRWRSTQAIALARRTWRGPRTAGWRARSRAARNSDQPPANSRPRWVCSSISRMRVTAAVEERPVVRHHHHRAGEASPRTPRAGRGRRSRGCWWARRAAARRGATAGSPPAARGPPRRPTAWSSAGRSFAWSSPQQPDRRAGLGGPGLEVVAAEGQEAVERRGVGVEGVGVVGRAPPSSDRARRRPRPRRCGGAR